MSLPTNNYRLFNRTFLNSVRWFFSYQTNEDLFVERFRSIMESLGYQSGSIEPKAIMMKKSGLSIVANGQLLLLNCSADSYKGFEVLRKELRDIFSVLEKLGITELINVTCSKENVYTVNKDLIKKPLTEALMVNSLFKGELLKNPIYVDSRDNLHVVANRTYTDSLLEAKMQLVVSVFVSYNSSLSFVWDKLDEIDKVSFDAFVSVISDGLISVMEK